eukprot:8153355-Alexandrium_andersonii.AAC.1
MDAASRCHVVHILSSFWHLRAAKRKQKRLDEAAVIRSVRISAIRSRPRLPNVNNPVLAEGTGWGYHVATDPGRERPGSQVATPAVDTT